MRRRHVCSHQVHSPCPIETGQGLPRFSKPLGLDFIITPEGRGVLIELQHGFGKRGLLHLYPAANRLYRRKLRSLVREQGVCFELVSGLRTICHDKIRTYQFFSDYQPPSLAYRRWSPAVAAWLEALEAEVVLVKPPQESCGRGIRVFGREALLELAERSQLVSPALIQSFVPCRQLLGEDGQAHVGCIRHIVLLVSDGAKLSFVHLPSYWRVSPVPWSWTPSAPDRDALTANISRGATPLAVSDDDEVTVRGLTDRICSELLGLILGRAEVPLGASRAITPEGSFPEDDEAALVMASSPCHW